MPQSTQKSHLIIKPKNNRMKKALVIIGTLLFLSSTTYCQLTKGNWLAGGNASFSSVRNSSTGSTIYNQSTIALSPNVGYFFADKFAVGLRPSIVFVKSSLGNSNKFTDFKVAAFGRYYLLEPSKIYNIVTEASYGIGISKVSGQNDQLNVKTYAFSGGPVIFFNSSVGLEFLVSYSSTKAALNQGRNNEIRLGIGFQIHLEKE